MPASLSIALNILAVCLMPLAIFSLIKRPQPSEAAPFARLYRVEPKLQLAGDLLLLFLGLGALVRLGLHYGLIEPSLGQQLDGIITVPFLFFVALSCALMIRAAIRLRRQSSAGN